MQLKQKKTKNAIIKFLKLNFTLLLGQIKINLKIKRIIGQKGI